MCWLSGCECPGVGVFGLEDQDVEADGPNKASGSVVIHPLGWFVEDRLKPFVGSGRDWSGFGGGGGTGIRCPEGLPFFLVGL